MSIDFQSPPPLQYYYFPSLPRRRCTIHEDRPLSEASTLPSLYPFSTPPEKLAEQVLRNLATLWPKLPEVPSQRCWFPLLAQNSCKRAFLVHLETGLQRHLAKWVDWGVLLLVAVRGAILVNLGTHTYLIHIP